jgi:hypothetical protein
MNRTQNLLATSLFALLLAMPSRARAEVAGPAESAPSPYATRASVMAGLAQWLLWGGGNVAAQIKVDRWVFEYSHGQALKFERAPTLGLTADERDAGVSVGMPWTTGGGFGYQITPRLHVLLEVKAHRYEVRGADQNQVARYTSITVGPGVFYDFYLYEGLFLQPSLRWWPTVASTYEASASVFTRTDGSTYAHARHELVPFVNVSLGWTFSGRAAGG